MSILLHGDCIDEMKGIESNSVDLIYTDLPYATKSFGKCTDCEWDKPIDLDKMWKELMRIKKLHTPLFFSCNVKLGYDLIRTCPKKCPFRYDLIWCKSAKSGFLLSKKQPLRAHEFVYVFYERQPFYNIDDNHKHKFLDSKNGMKGQDDLIYGKSIKQVQNKQYDPPLPTAIINKDNNCKYDVNKNMYGGGKEDRIKISKDKKDHEAKYDPPLPSSTINKDSKQVLNPDSIYGDITTEDNKQLGGHLQRYDPPLPSSTINKDSKVDKVELKDTVYGETLTVNKIQDRKCRKEIYDPPLPVSTIKQEYPGNPVMREDTTYGNVVSYEIPERKNGEPRYEPPLPDSLLEVKSERGKHQTQKPVELINWILKYYTKPGDVVFDCCMGSGSMGVACKGMDRNFIGIELNPEIYEVAVNRIEG